jgi:16S rRNA processing protein RimM
LSNAAGGGDPDGDTIVVGVVGKPHGLRGEITLRPYNPGGSAFDGVERLILERDGAREERAVESLRNAGAVVLAKLADVDDRDAAAALTGAVVRLPRAALPALAPGEYYVEDVVGCAVTREDGTPLGVVKGTFWNGANDVITVVDSGGRERLLPLVPDFVLAVDIAGRRIVVRWDDDDD